MFEKSVLRMFYEKASKPEDLPWHTDAPPELVLEALKARPYPSRILDVGCGAGVHAIHLAKLGHHVTGLDVMPKAIAMARARAGSEKVSVTWVEADLFRWSAPGTFDVILDSGTLHTIGDVRGYKARLLSWLAPRGDFVLAHWGKRHALDWRPVGPRRRSRERLARLFAPDLDEERYVPSVIAGIPFPIGPSALGQAFWFSRNDAPR